MACILVSVLSTRYKTIWNGRVEAVLKIARLDLPKVIL